MKKLVLLLTVLCAVTMSPFLVDSAKADAWFEDAVCSYFGDKLESPLPDDGVVKDLFKLCDSDPRPGEITYYLIKVLFADSPLDIETVYTFLESGKWDLVALLPSEYFTYYPDAYVASILIEMDERVMVVAVTD